MDHKGPVQRRHLPIQLSDLWSVGLFLPARVRGRHMEAGRKGTCSLHSGRRYWPMWVLYPTCAYYMVWHRGVLVLGYGSGGGPDYGPSRKKSYEFNQVITPVY